MVASPEDIGNSDVIPQKTEEQVQNDSDVDDFFDRLDREVNDVTYDNEPTEVTHQQVSGPESATHVESQDGSSNVDWESDSNPYKKRYSDSSKEAVRLNEQYKDVEPFVPVLNAMKEDSGLVEVVRDYLKDGGKPSKTIQEQLNLDEDFVFDAQEAMQDPESDSARVMSAHVDSIVQRRIGQVVDAGRKKAAVNQQALERKKQEQAFREKHPMSDEEYNVMVERAKKHVLTMDDVFYILNREKNAENVRNATQQDMLDQMKNVRNMPTSASASNSTSETQTTEEQLFESVFGKQNETDSLFG